MPSISPSSGELNFKQGIHRKSGLQQFCDDLRHSQSREAVGHEAEFEVDDRGDLLFIGACLFHGRVE